jgi:hypothetical protein
MIMHPRHSYAVLFNSEMDFMVEKLLRDKINDAKVWIAEAELEIDYFRKKNNQSELSNQQAILEAGQNRLRRTEQELSLWHSKKVTRIKKDQKEALFGIQKVS